MKSNLFGTSLAGVLGVVAGVVGTLSMAACSPAQTARGEAARAAAFKAGQLFCTYVTPKGSAIVAVASSLIPPPYGVIVTGLTSEVVKAACLAIDSTARPVSPPADASPDKVPVITAPIALGAPAAAQ